jgi:hypothetical protein
MVVCICAVDYEWLRLWFYGSCSMSPLHAIVFTSEPPLLAKCGIQHAPLIYGRCAIFGINHSLMRAARVIILIGVFGVRVGTLVGFVSFHGNAVLFATSGGVRIITFTFVLIPPDIFPLQANCRRNIDALLIGMGSEPPQLRRVPWPTGLC